MVPVYRAGRIIAATEHLHVVETLVAETLLAFEPHALLSWEMRPTAQSKDAARRDQYIEAMGEDRCVYCTTDIFLGLNADATMKNFGAWVKQGFDAVALGVQQRGSTSAFADLHSIASESGRSGYVRLIPVPPCPRHFHDSGNP